MTIDQIIMRPLLFLNTCLCCLFIWISSTTSGIAQTIEIQTWSLRVRDLPIHGTVIGWVKKGQRYSVLEEKRGWYRIEFAAQTYGWIPERYAKEVIPPEIPATIPAEKQTVSTQTSIEPEIPSEPKEKVEPKEVTPPEIPTALPAKQQTVSTKTSIAPETPLETEEKVEPIEHVDTIESKNSFTNGIGMEFILIPAGSFWMGSDEYLENVAQNEIPRHHITITQPFYIGKYEVTQGQWAETMELPPVPQEERNLPVQQISWNDVQEFIYKLNHREGTSMYRLPTEAEWEYAARAGSESTFFFGNDENDLGEYAWYDDNSGSQPHPVGQKLANAWGLYDMHGNVWEWTQDWYDPQYYQNSPSMDPPGPSTGRAKIMRGGGWNNGPFFSRLVKRVYDWPDSKHAFLGFRLVTNRPISP